MSTAKYDSLIVLGCSATKFPVQGQVPAIHLYDGPVYRVLRAHLRTHRWPEGLSLGILSAKYGLIGGVAPIETYDQRMTADRADELRAGVASTFDQYMSGKTRVNLVLGKDYLRALSPNADWTAHRVTNADGPIGMKLQQFSRLLSTFPNIQRVSSVPVARNRPLYFLPDWDDFLDVEFDFKRDAFSADKRSDRNQAHSIELLRPKRVCDGVLVSLAQHLGTKGLLRRLPPADLGHLRPQSVREHFGLMKDQWAFGDCGAFSYANQHDPAFSVEQAVAVYELYDFDMGASVDHIPLPELADNNGARRMASEYERQRRVKLTRENAAEFLTVWRARNCKFIPVGVIQALSPKGYAKQVSEYMEMGYRFIALGGLVPKSDDEIRTIVQAVDKALSSCRERPWIHLLGIFRPKLQELFRSGGVSSFDSASYFRKAWLRSDQNYLGVDGNWYAAIRVPPSNDPRTLVRLKNSGTEESRIKRLEQDALAALRQYDRGKLAIDECLKQVLEYDSLLNRGEYSSNPLISHYRRTLANRPWAGCSCNFCRNLGIDIVVFRGYNRNKRRGAHNTLQLYNQLSSNPESIHRRN